MTVDRAVYIELPLRYTSIVTDKRTVMAVVMIWVLNLVQSSSMIKWAFNETPESSCIGINENLIHRAGLYVTLFELFVLTLFVLVPLYGKVAYTSWRLIQNEPHFSNFPADRRAEQRKKVQERKLTTTLGAVFLFYIICYFPLAIFSGIISTMYDPPYPFAILVLIKILFLVHRLQIVLNPVVYYRTNKLIRTAYQKMFCRNAVTAYIP